MGLEKFPFWFPNSDIFTARKRSLWQGNVFIGVCLPSRGRVVGFPACITGHMTRGVYPTTPGCKPPLVGNLEGLPNPPSAQHADPSGCRPPSPGCRPPYLLDADPLPPGCRPHFLDFWWRLLWVSKPTTADLSYYCFSAEKYNSYT